MQRLGAIESPILQFPIPRQHIEAYKNEIEGNIKLLNSRQINELNSLSGSPQKWKLNYLTLSHKNQDLYLGMGPLLNCQFYTSDKIAQFRSKFGYNLELQNNWLLVYYSIETMENSKYVKANHLTQEPGYTKELDLQIVHDYQFTVHWTWGDIGIQKLKYNIGTYSNYPIIHSEKPPSYPHLSLNLNPVKWFTFKYIHGKLGSSALDSAKTYSYNNYDYLIYHNKYIAANLFTFSFPRQTHISFGNSVIYSGQGIKAEYLIPILFYKSVDHTYNGMTNSAGQNSQLYINLSTKPIPEIFIYGSLFLDDLSFKRMIDKDKHSNHWSMKAGFHIPTILDNLSFSFEYSRSNPLVYKNGITTVTYESNGYIMGHYLKDNSDECYLSMVFRPSMKWNFSAEFKKIRKGPDLPYIDSPDPITGTNIWGRKFMENVEFDVSTVLLMAQYNIKRFLSLSIQYITSSAEGDYHKYLPKEYHGIAHNFEFSLKYGY